VTAIEPEPVRAVEYQGSDFSKVADDVIGNARCDARRLESIHVAPCVGLLDA